MKLLRKLDEIIEDPRKSKEVLKFLSQHGMLDDTMIAMWEIEQGNIEIQKCNHKHLDGSDATYDAAGYTTCRICDASDFPGDGL